MLHFTEHYEKILVPGEVTAVLQWRSQRYDKKYGETEFSVGSAGDKHALIF